uniref:Uncharacterized protein n=1 Tax=Marmota marmota marmota TaxID=9994 RepID=A0A8C6A1G9_MARMA
PLGQACSQPQWSVVTGCHSEAGPGKNSQFLVENRWQLLVMMTLYFRSGCAALFILERLKR